MSDQRPSWMVPPQYNDEPEIPRSAAVDDDAPIDYSKGPDRSVVFGDDLDDEEPTEDLGS